MATTIVDLEHVVVELIWVHLARVEELAVVANEPEELSDDGVLSLMVQSFKVIPDAFELLIIRSV